jgi:hypothetical protein
MLLAGTGLVTGGAAILALGVIPPGRTDPYWDSDVIRIFWVLIIANVLVGAALLGTMLVTRRAGCASKVLLVAAGLVALALGFLLLDAALAELEHPGMQGVAVSLFACVGADLAAGVLAFISAVVRLRQPPSQ